MLSKRYESAEVGTWIMRVWREFDLYPTFFSSLYIEVAVMNFYVLYPNSPMYGKDHWSFLNQIKRCHFIQAHVVYSWVQMSNSIQGKTVILLSIYSIENHSTVYDVNDLVNKREIVWFPITYTWGPGIRCRFISVLSTNNMQGWFCWKQNKNNFGSFPSVSWKKTPDVRVSRRGGGGGVNFHYKGIYRRAAGRGILFRPPSIWMGIIFIPEVYQISFSPKKYMNE